ncbi:hypothetical protein ACHAQA_004458 [Verticillium albo-atrum]
MPEHDALVLAYSHLGDFPRANEALVTLKKVASLVKPIMRARGWRVRELAEFYPDQFNLLGLNVNRGQRILLRLRHPGDRAQFVPVEQVIDTMLHELSHIVHGPHDGKFHALWNQLRDEHEGLVMKGYTGEGFLSDGHRLGGNGQKPMHEARRLARAAAEKRRVRNAGSGQRLGGAAPRPGQDIRRTIAGAAERRNTTLQGCGNTNHDEREIQAISETATRNGFRTQAEEDAANEAAIAQALWELVQEEEKQKYGNYYAAAAAASGARVAFTVTDAGVGIGIGFVIPRIALSDFSNAACYFAEGMDVWGVHSSQPGDVSRLRRLRHGTRRECITAGVDAERSQTKSSVIFGIYHHTYHRPDGESSAQGQDQACADCASIRDPFGHDQTPDLAVLILWDGHGPRVVDVSDVWKHEGQFTMSDTDGGPLGHPHAVLLRSKVCGF